MPTDTSEKELERILTAYLRDKQGYEQGASDDYNKEYGIDTERLKRFILATQKDKVQNTQCFANGGERAQVFQQTKPRPKQQGRNLTPLCLISATT